MNNNKNEAIQILRGLLILCIAVYHYTARYSQIYSDVDYSFMFEKGGSLGNVMFMQMSGFFLAKSLILPVNNIKSYFSFCLNKWWRLFPGVILTTSIIYLFVFYAPLVEERKVSLIDFLLNFLIIHPTVPYVDGAHWFIATLLQLQLIIGLSILLKKRDRIRILVFVSIISVLLFFLKIGVFNMLLCGYWFPILLSGIIVYFVKDELIPKYYIIIPLITVMISSCIFQNIYIILFFLLFILVVFGYFQTIKYPSLLVQLGNISFSWYLIHQNIGYCIINVARNFGISSEFFLVSLAISLTLILAIPINKLLDLIPKKIFA